MVSWSRRECHLLVFSAMNRIRVLCLQLTFGVKDEQIKKILINQYNFYTILFLLPYLTLIYKLIHVKEEHIITEDTSVVSVVAS